MGALDLNGLQSSLFFESPEEIFTRVFRELKPRTAVPQLRLEFCRFANADSFISLKDGLLAIRVSDLLAGAPAPVLEALAHILLGKLYRKPIAAIYSHRYRLYLNRRDVRRQAHLVKQIRGRKFISGPQAANSSTSNRYSSFSMPDSLADFWAGPCSAGAAALRAACWDTSTPRITPLLSAVFLIKRTRLPSPWNTSCTTKCCICDIPWTTPVRAAACIPGNSASRKRNFRN